MSDALARQSSKEAVSIADVERFLSELDSTMSQQISLAGNDDLKAILVLAGRVDEILQQVETVCVKFPPTCAERLKRVRDLHRRLSLIFAQRREELGQKIARLTRGKKGLGAYRDASARC